MDAVAMLAMAMIDFIFDMIFVLSKAIAFAVGLARRKRLA